MSELAKAYVQIVPSAKGIKSALEETLGGPLQTTGPKLGQTLAQKMGTGLQSIGGAMTSYITKPALAAVTALGGATLFSGWKRMTEIDNAKVKLQAIGNSAKDMEKITTSALTSVKGTAYGMNEAMTTSASAVAAGIQPGKELTKYLTAISDAAAVAGTDMSSMGSIFNKVATQGKAHNDVLQQMSEAGIPIYQYLADQLGVTAEEVFDLASAGKIGLADFQTAVTEHIGGAAQEIGSNTITGAISNVKAAISRIGANFLGSADDADSFAGKVLPMLNNLMANLEPVEAKAKELGSKFADAFGKFADAVSKIPLPVLAGIAGALVSIGPAISIITTLSGAMSALGIAISGPVIAVGAIAAALALAYASCEPFRAAVNGLVKELVSAFAPILKTVGEFLKVVISEVMSCAQAIGSALAPVIQLVTPILKVFATLVGVKLNADFKLLAAVVRTAGAVIKAMAAIVQGVFTAIGRIIAPMGKKFKDFAKGVKDNLSFSGLAGKVSGVFNSVKEKILSPVNAAKDKVKSIIDAIKGFFRFSVSAPHIPVPHFNITPAGWKIGDLLKGVKPHLNVSWYAKGGIVDGATLIGAGEKGAEAIVPLDPFWKKLESATGNTFNVTVNVSGAEDPEAWADSFARRLEMKARAF